MKHAVHTLTALVTGMILSLLPADPALAADPAKDFRQNCYGCHTIGGGRRTGPDLKDVTKRKERPWLVGFIIDPAGVLDSGDPYALKLLDEARGQRMTPIAGMSRDRAEALLDLMEAESAKAKEDLRFPGIQISSRPFTPADVARGLDLFQGREVLTAGGPACLGCHTVGGLGGLGGGRLGPDLTKVFERYETRDKLATWLTAPATETMLPTFRDHPMKPEEVLALVAYFKDVASRPEDTAPSSLVFVLLGLGGTVVVLLLFGRVWNFRFRDVREPLVHPAVDSN